MSLSNLPHRSVRRQAALAAVLASSSAIGALWLFHYAFNIDSEAELGTGFAALVAAPVMGLPAVIALVLLAWSQCAAMNEGWSATRGRVTAALWCSGAAVLLPLCLLGLIL